MASSFTQGTPLSSFSTTASSTETPKWMQEAIYNQIYAAGNVAQTPYESYDMQRVAGTSPLQQQAYQQVQDNQGMWSPALQAAQQGTLGLAASPGGYSAALPYAQKAEALSGVDAAKSYMDAGLNTSGLAAAQPYLSQSAQSSAGGIQDFMNPYQQQVMDTMAKQGARNLRENLLPAVSDSFVRAGQFGGSRMGEFGSRALRDTQESVLNQQGQLAQQGYGQALTAAQQEQSRLAGIGSTAGQLAGQQQSAMMSAGQNLGSLTQGQQQLLASLGQQAGTLSQADMARQQSALGQLAAMAQQGQGMATQDAAALEAAGRSQQGQQQAELDAAYQQWQQQQLYPKQQLDWLSTQVRGMAPITPQMTTQSTSGTGQTYSASPLSQLASGLATGAGLYNSFK